MWYAKNTGAYTLGSAEANNNAVMIYNTLTAMGYAYNPICAILGNIGYESGYNPWRWQSDYVVASNQTNYINYQTGHAYGLLQFDPAGQYINNATARTYPEFAPNFSNQAGRPEDGAGQLKYMNNLSGGYIQTAAYPISFAQFKVSTQTVAYLTRAWMYNYERGTWSNLRETYALYWEQNLSGLIPSGNLPIWLLFKLKERRY